MGLLRKLSVALEVELDLLVGSAPVE